MGKRLLTIDERDILLIRLDERMRAIKDGDEGDIPEIKKHLAKQNGKIAWIPPMKWMIGLMFMALLALFTRTVGIW